MSQTAQDTRPRRPGRPDRLELTLLLVLAVALFGWLLLPERDASDDEIAMLRKQLAAAYGPHRYSNAFEEWIIRDYFKDRRGGTFVDVGAWHWQTASNTYYLERHLGWRGLAIDASDEFLAQWPRHRPDTPLLIAFVSDADGDTATLFRARISQTNSSSRDVAAGWGAGVTGTITVPTVTLNTALVRLC